jgi:thioredoxin reductase
MAKGVDVENYPGMPRANGGQMIQVMKQQARGFFADVRDDMVISINTTNRPFEIYTNTTGLVRAHSIILATGANSRWLNAEGEWELRGAGVSSCATCDGYLFKGKTCLVVGGGDTAMEEALFLSRICSQVTLIHRRDSFRASSVMQKRVLSNSKIEVRWNTELAKYIGKSETINDEERYILKAVMLKSTTEPDAPPTEFNTDAVFVAIGHDPNTEFVKGQLDMDESGYLVVQGRSTSTSVPGIFAAGDVADHTYRQAVTSAGSGSAAAIDAERYLSESLPEEDDTCVRQEDFKAWSLKDLRAQVQLLGLKCVACTEKSDFISSLQATY